MSMMNDHTDSSCSSSDDDGDRAVYIDNSRHGHQQYNSRGGGGGYDQPQVVYVRGEQQEVGDQDDSEQDVAGEVDDTAIESHITTSDFSGGVYTFEVYAEIEDSMDNMGMIDGQAEWTPQAGNEYIFQRVASVVDGVPQRVGNLRKGVLLGAKWKWYRNDHAVDVGLEVSGIRGNVHTQTGKAFSAVAPANQFYKDGEECFQPAHIMSRNMLENYSLCKIEEIDNDIKPEAGEAWSYVKASSVIIDLLKANKEYFGIEMRMPSSRDGLIKVNNKVIEVCRKYLEEQQDIPFIDFNKFAIKAHRIDGEEWGSPKNVINDISGHDECDKAHFETTRLHDVKKICGVLQITAALLQ